MDVESDIKKSSVDTLLKYNELAKSPANHLHMIKDKTMLNFLAYVLDSDDIEVLEASLDTIELLCKNSSNRSTIRETFGVLQSLQSLAANKNLNNVLSEKAQIMIQLINTPDNEEMRQTNDKENHLPNEKVLRLHIYGLHDDTQKDLENVLTKKVKGVISVVVDVEHQRCIVTAVDQLDPKCLALAISRDTTMEARLVSKNKFNQEILVSLMDTPKEIDIQELPPYLEEKESPVKEKAVKSMKDIRITASEWFSVAAGILQRSFYW